MVPLEVVYMFKDIDIVILIGAGCSMEAGIPTSKKMVEELEELLENKWEEYLEFYHFIKSAILYSDGIKGNYTNDFDIERLVIVLSELEKKESCILYPFVGSWNPRLIEIAGYDFGIIRKFKQKILEQLKDWVTLRDYKSADYYRRFFDFQSELNHLLRIFSLNYDLCLEKNKPHDKDLERGFDPQTKTWDWRRFYRRDEYEPFIYLYKLHGSIDWERDPQSEDIIESDKTPDIPDLIFGTDYKMQYIDPYLFHAYELRKYSLESSIILTIGYSFRDEHINKILERALLSRKGIKAIIVSPTAKKVADRFPKIRNRLIPIEKKAKDFLNELSTDFLEDIMITSRNP
jgi:hypothetical protein